MDGIYAASLSLSQSVDGTSCRAHLLYSSGGTAREFTLDFAKLGDINANGDASEWLYAALGRLLMEYDAHDVLEARVMSVGELAKELRHEA